MLHRSAVFLMGFALVGCGESTATPDAPEDAARDAARDLGVESATDAPATDAPATDTPAIDAAVDAPVDAARVDAITPPDLPATDSAAGDAARDASVVTPGDPGAVEVRLTVRADQPRSPISPLIYGWNSPDWSRTHNVTTVRVGGNRMTAWNWETNASNAGSDYMFQNDNYLCQNAGCDRAGEVTRRAVDSAFAHDASIVLTVPMAGYVSADIRGDGDVRRSGADYLTTRFRRSVARKTAPFALSPDLTDSAVYQDEYVHWVETTYAPSARVGRSIFYALDNEPDLWASTHAQIHPAALTYAELIARSTELAGAIKDAAPSALVFGPVSYGWQGYVTLQDAPDARGRDFLDTYLDAMRAASTTAGRRLIDALDLHWYPEAQGGGTRVTEDSASDAVADARVQSARSLWDPSYTEASWITMYSTRGPIRLIPRMREKIAAHDPGMRLAFTEYYYGGGADISGAIAEADALGVFGREGVFLAALWHTGSTDDRFPYAALAMYRDFDGAGGRFGDTSVRASSSDDARAAVYASLDASGRMVLVAINRTRAPVTAGVLVTDAARYARAEVWQLTAASPAPVRAAALTAAADNAFRYAMPARSVSTLVLRP